MPSRGSPGLDDAAFATDISASVSDEDYQTIVTEVSGVFKKMKPRWLHYLQFSDTITSINKVKSVRELKKIEFVGRGGTDIKEVIEWANKNNPRVLVFLTDGEFYWPDIKPTCDVVWLIHNNPSFTAEYGKVIHYEIES
jgi:predicted metal-dependent peptidase